MNDSPALAAQFTASKHPTALGVVCGAGAALCWALGFVAARHGITDRHVAAWYWRCTAMSGRPGAASCRRRGRLRRSRRHRLGRGIVLTLFGGLPLALLSYSATSSCRSATARSFSRPARRLAAWCWRGSFSTSRCRCAASPGALAIVAGLGVIGIEALRTMGAHGFRGDLMFVAAGSSFAVFGMLVRLWRIPAMRAAAITSVVVACRLAAAVLLLRQILLAAGFLRKSDAGGGAGRARRRRRDLICSPAPWFCSAPGAPSCFPRWCRRSRC